MNGRPKQSMKCKPCLAPVGRKPGDTQRYYQVTETINMTYPYVGDVLGENQLDELIRYQGINVTIRDLSAK